MKVNGKLYCFYNEDSSMELRSLTDYTWHSAKTDHRFTVNDDGTHFVQNIEYDDRFPLYILYILHTVKDEYGQGFGEYSVIKVSNDYKELEYLSESISNNEYGGYRDWSEIESINIEQIT